MRFNFNINPRMRKELRDIAKAEGRTSSDLVKEAVIKLIHDKKKKAMELKKKWKL